MRVIGVLHVGADDSDVGPYRGKLEFRVVAAARSNSVSLSYMVLADDLEDEIAAFIAEVPCVEQVLELRVHVQPAMRVTVRFVPNAIALSPIRGIYNRARHSHTLLLYDQALRVVHVCPKARVTLG